MDKVYENTKMIVEVDGIDTVFVTNKAGISMTSIQVNDEDGFIVIYHEGAQALTSAALTSTGFEILFDSEGVVSPSDEEIAEETVEEVE